MHHELSIMAFRPTNELFVISILDLRTAAREQKYQITKPLRRYLSIWIRVMQDKNDVFDALNYYLMTFSDVCCGCYKIWDSVPWQKGVQTKGVELTERGKLEKAHVFFVLFFLKRCMYVLYIALSKYKDQQRLVWRIRHIVGVLIDVSHLKSFDSHGPFGQRPHSQWCDFEGKGHGVENCNHGESLK